MIESSQMTVTAVWKAKYAVTGQIRGVTPRPIVLAVEVLDERE
jgi:hypothetical protein